MNLMSVRMWATLLAKVASFDAVLCLAKLLEAAATAVTPSRIGLC